MTARPGTLADLYKRSLDAATRPASDPTTPYRLYVIHQRDGSPASHSFCPPATGQEVGFWYPDALSIKVQPDRTSSSPWPCPWPLILSPPPGPRPLRAVPACTGAAIRSGTGQGSAGAWSLPLHLSSRARCGPGP